MRTDRLYKVAYEEAVRALSEQQSLIESFRTRAGLLFSAAAVTTFFLGAQALRGGASNPTAWLALLCFLGVAVASLAILWPRPWEGIANPHELIETYVESGEPAPIEDLHRDLSLYMHDSYMENQDGVEHFALLLQLASSLLTSEVVLWIAALAASD